MGSCSLNTNCSRGSFLNKNMIKIAALFSLALIFLFCQLCSAQNAPAEGGEEDPLEALRKNIPGEPGKDYPIFSTNILCKINPANPGCRGGGGKKKKGKKNQGKKKRCKKIEKKKKKKKKK